MKAEELMIGDYIKHGFGGIGKVTELSKGIVTVYDKGLDDGEGNCEVNFAENEIQPIPLTPEILEKNGFVIKKKWAQIGNFGDSPLIMWHFEDNATLHDFKHELEIHQNDTGKVHITIPCEYVHELQHALRLCSIDKEIVL